MSRIREFFVSVAMEDKVSGKFQQIDNQINRTESRFQRFQGGLNRFGASMTRNVTAPIMGVAAAAGGMAVSVANQAEEIALSAEKANMSAESYQRMKFAMGELNVEQSDFNRAVQRLNQRLGDAQSEGGKYKDVLLDLGFAQEDIKEGNITVEDSFDDILMKLHELEDGQKQAALAGDLFGTTLGRALMPAIQDAEKLEELIEGADDFTHIFDDEDIEKAEKFNSKLDKLKYAFQGAMQEIGMELIPVLKNNLMPLVEDSILPAIGRFTERVIGLIEWFTELHPTWQRTIGIAAGLLVALGPIASVISNVMTVVQPLVRLFVRLGGVKAMLAKAAPVLGKALMVITGPVGWIIGAIAGLITLGVLLYRNWDTVSEYAVQIWGGIRDFFSDLWSSIRDIFSRAWEWIQETFIDNHPAVLIYRHWDEIIDWFHGLWESVQDVFSTALDWIRTLFWDYHPAVLIYNNWEEITDWFSGLWGRVQEVFSSAWEWIQDLFMRYHPIGILISHWEEVTDWFSGLWSDIRSTFSDGISNIIEGFRNLPSRIYESISGLGQGLKDRVSGALDSVRDLLPFSPPKEGPLLDLDDSGEGMMDYIQSGIDRKDLKIPEPKVDSPALGQAETGQLDSQDIWTRIDTGLEKLIGTVRHTGQEILQQMRDRIEPVLEPQVATAGPAPREVSPPVSRREDTRGEPNYYNFSPTVSINFQSQGERPRREAEMTRRELEKMFPKLMDEFFRKADRKR